MWYHKDLLVHCTSQPTPQAHNISWKKNIFCELIINGIKSNKKCTQNKYLHDDQCLIRHSNAQKNRLIFCVERDNANGTRCCFLFYFQSTKSLPFSYHKQNGNWKMAAFVVIELIIHRNAQHGFYTLLSCHHYDGAACLFSSAIKLLMNALSVAIASLIKLNFIQRNETHFSWCSSNKCNAAVHTRILSVSMTLRCFFNRFNIDKE